MKSTLLACVVVGIGCSGLAAEPLAERAPAAQTAPEATTAVLPQTTTQAPRPAARPAYISPGAAEVVKMTQAGIEPAVIKDFVEHSPSAYAPGAGEIIYLRDEGVSSEIITALIKRGSVLRAQAMQSTRENLAQAAAQPAAPNVVTAPQPVVVTQPAQTVTQPVYVYQTPQYVSYPYPNYYYYNYGYTSPFAFQLGFYPRSFGWGNHYRPYYAGHHAWGAPYRPGFGAHFAAGPVRIGGSIHRRW